MSLSSNHPTVIWCTAEVSADTSGKSSYSASISLTPSGSSAVSLTVQLYVFGFTLDVTGHFQTYFQSTPTTSLSSYSLSELDDFKAVYLKHRWNSRNTAWSGGFSYRNGYWDSSSKTLVDADPATSTTSCVWANGCLGLRYSTGQGRQWDGVNTGPWVTGTGGFNVWEYSNVESGRPSQFDGVNCGTNPGYQGSQWSGWMCSNAYEAEFAKYLQALEAFTDKWGLNDQINRAFFYTMNEPQDYNDYTIAAYLCKTFKSAAPNLPLMLTREASPWITDRADSISCGYDIWVAHVQRFPPDFTWDRQANHGETSWFYSLDTDNNCGVAYGKTCSNCVCNPAFSPFISNTGSNGDENPKALNTGMHYRVIPWVAWANRITGWGYYKDSVVWTQDNPATIDPVRPTISASIFREGFEDYEYLWKANGGAQPSPYSKLSVDDAVLSVAFAVNSWNDDPYALHALRHQLGRYIEGSRNDMPYITQPHMFDYGSYFIDFGPYNLVGNDYGAATSFSQNGVNWMGMGYPNYDVSRGYGWNSQMMGLPNTIQAGNPILHCQDTQASADTVVNTVCYNDYNHPDYFFFALAPGNYHVTVAVGWPDRSRDDIEYIQINTVVLRNHTCSGDCFGVREYSADIVVHPHSNGGTLVMTVGSPFVNQYTILSYLKIEATGATQSTTTTKAQGSTSSNAQGTTTSTKASSSKVTTTTTHHVSSVASQSLILSFFVAFLGYFFFSLF